MKDLDFEIKKGEFIAVVGDVGSGKSSLLRSLVGDLINLQESEIKKIVGPQSLNATVDNDTLAKLSKALLSNSYDSNNPVKVIED